MREKKQRSAINQENEATTANTLINFNSIIRLAVDGNVKNKYQMERTTSLIPINYTGLYGDFAGEMKVQIDGFWTSAFWWR